MNHDVPIARQGSILKLIFHFNISCIFGLQILKSINKLIFLHVSIDVTIYNERIPKLP